MANALFFTGRIAAAPVLTRQPNGDAVCKFTLIRNESRGYDDNDVKREDRVVDVQFTAFGGRAETIAKNCFVGDQLEVCARLERNRFTKEGVERYEHNFIVESFEFGAPGKVKRDQLDARQRNGQGEDS